jgi:hypothetical protein
LPTTLTGVKSIRVDFSGTPEQFGTNLTYYELNRLVGGDHFELTYNPGQDTVTRIVNPLTTRSRSGGGSSLRMAGEIYRSVPFGLNRVHEDDLPKLIDRQEELQSSKSFLLSLFPLAGGRLERDTSFVGTFAGEISVGTSVWPKWKSTLTFEED